MRRKKEGMSKTTRIVLVVGGFLLGTMLIFGGIFMPYIVEAIRFQGLKSNVETFLKPPSRTETAERPYINGKAVIVDAKRREVHRIQQRLRDDIRAQSADEVGTVILVEWDFVPVYGGQYGGLTGHYGTGKLTIIDRAKDAVIGEHKVMGPTSAVTSGRGGRYAAPPGMQTATEPWNETVGYINSLPRQ
jgi:hypothetical protein